ncbi:alpha/beta fold hydrolase [Pseudoalteromonas sp. A22]|uniref:alpha/beta fold hydrolase n=1 Tax=Pseudoalteromonas sp. A22 TaxID=327511 RepID=UPI001BA89956|nr:alpha/beta hydrolase [Pseudoalteromonas sp. A22]QUI65063.1 alpha/beta fold hydrolase [Pseudoalteromonas sp. A22]
MKISSLVITMMCLSIFTVNTSAKEVQIDDNLTIHYEQSGSGDTTIIFIPGWMMSSEVFEHQLAHFKESTKYTAVAFDPRGQGKSSKPVEGHTYQQHARDLAQFIKKLDLKNVILAGWSYGVTEQLAYLNQFGADKIKAMIMIDTGPDIAGATYDEWVWYLNDDSDGYSRSFTEGIIEDRENVIREFVKWMLENPSPENVAWLSKIASNTSSSVASIQNATGFYLDYSADLLALDGKMPLLYIVREEKKKVAEKWIKSNTPSATAVYMGKHMMFWERPNEFNKALDEFLSSIESK